MPVNNPVKYAESIIDRPQAGSKLVDDAKRENEQSQRLVFSMSK